jgi:hypothetical protein
VTPADLRARRSRGELAHVVVEPLPDVRTAGVAAARPAEQARHRGAPESDRLMSPPAPPAATSPASPSPSPATGATMIVRRRYALVLDDGRRIEIDADGVIGRAPAVAEGELAVAGRGRRRGARRRRERALRGGSQRGRLTVRLRNIRSN